MTDENELVSQGDARLFYQFRQDDELQSLIESVDEFTYTLDDLHDEEVRENGDARVVFLRTQEDESTNYIARGVFEQNGDEEYELADVRIEQSTVYGPLAGHGVRWFFEGGELVEREWVS